jgi:DNA-binding NtrC family response regulator
MSMGMAEDGLADESPGRNCHHDDAARLVKERLIGVSRWATEARAAVTAHAAHDQAIIVEGEPGTGKEFMARLIHECSARGHGSFISVCCEGTSEQSIEALLFGWIRELPSGRNRTQRGLVESAQGGTLYISGVADLPSILKAKVARLIQYGEYRRWRDPFVETTDIRIILGSTPASSSSEKKLSVEQRFAAVGDRVSIPPLRLRKADVEPLSRHFVNQYCRQLGKELRELSSTTIALLQRYDWPGNISELKQVSEHLVQQSIPSYLDASLLPGHIINSPAFSGHPLSTTGIELSEEVKQYERSLLCSALKQCHGMQTKAARLLGLKLTTLNTKIARYGIDVKSFQ